MADLRPHASLEFSLSTSLLRGYPRHDVVKGVPQHLHRFDNWGIRGAISSLVNLQQQQQQQQQHWWQQQQQQQQQQKGLVKEGSTQTCKLSKHAQALWQLWRSCLNAYRLPPLLPPSPPPLLLLQIDLSVTPPLEILFRHAHTHIHTHTYTGTRHTQLLCSVLPDYVARMFCSLMRLGIDFKTEHRTPFVDLQSIKDYLLLLQPASKAAWLLRWFTGSSSCIMSHPLWSNSPQDH
jgi:hypothetical protein